VIGKGNGNPDGGGCDASVVASVTGSIDASVAGSIDAAVAGSIDAAVVGSIAGSGAARYLEKNLTCPFTIHYSLSDDW